MSYLYNRKNYKKVKKVPKVTKANEKDRVQELEKRMVTLMKKEKLSNLGKLNYIDWNALAPGYTVSRSQAISYNVSYFQVNNSSANSNAGPSTNQFSAGVHTGDFTGQSLNMEYIKYKLQVSTADTTNIVRLIWFWDSDSTTSTGAVNTVTNADILADYSTDGSGLTNYGTAFSQYNLQTVGKSSRFQILKDRTYNLNTDQGSILEQGIIKVNRKLTFRAAGTLSNTIPEQNVMLMALSDSAATPHPGLVIQTRTYYRT